jgi:hypothetical protein
MGRASEVLNERSCGGREGDQSRDVGDVDTLVLCDSKEERGHGEREHLFDEGKAVVVRGRYLRLGRQAHSHQ